MKRRTRSMLTAICLSVTLAMTGLPVADYTAHGQDGGGQSPTYLPLVGGQPAPPEFTIISPAAGLSVSGTSLFAIQPLEAASITSVAFRAGSLPLGTDTTPLDGFQVYLDASQLPAGPLQLTATATGRTGDTIAKSISVTVAPNPPSNAAVDGTGATLATASGNTIVVPPGAVGESTNVAIEDKSQEEVTSEKGINWDALGVTFLGAIDVQTSGPISKPLGVSSVGFGNRIQPGQAVVTYRILPDADGDGVGELVVVNGANLAPNGTIVSSAVAGIVVTGMQVTAPAGATQAAGAALAGPPGALLTIEGNGFNPLSSVGNVAIFQSQVDGSTLTVPGNVEQTGSSQTFQVLLPPLPAGAATVMIKNQSTAETFGPFAVTINPPAALGQPAATIVENYFDQSIAAVQGLSNLTATQESQRTALLARLTELRTQFQELAANPAPQAQAMVNQFAVVIVGSGAMEELAAAVAAGNANAILCFTPHQKNVLNLIAGLAVVAGSLGCALALTGAGAAVCAAAFATAGLIDAFLIAEAPDCPKDPPPACTAAPAASGGGTTGMGSAPPPGGNGCGNAAGSGASSVQASGVQQLDNGRYTVKIFPQSGTGPALTPFTGATDPGGYFFLPLIPQGEPFRALALDNLTGANATFDGVGPATGQSVYMFLDFSGAQANRYAINIGDTVSDGVPAEGAGNIEIAGGLDIYTFEATAGQQVYFDIQTVSNTLGLVNWRLVDSAGDVLFDTCLGCSEPGVITLSQGGLYTVRVGADNNAGIGPYSFKLWHVPAPDRFAITIGDTVANGAPGAGAGNIESPGVRDSYTFSATPGQQVYFDIQTVSNTLGLVNWQLNDSTGASLFSTCLGCSEPGVITLTVGGAYTITVGEDRDDGFGPYSFQLWNVPTPAQFAITIGDTISNGVPGAGAGNIESPGVRDSYTFSATPGQQVYFDIQTVSNTLGLVNWQLIDSTGASLFSTCLGCSEPGVITLTVGGAYTITVGEDRDDGFGPYSFQLWNVPAPDQFAITVGDTISNGVPGPGAGNIESPGMRDSYTFNGTAGQQVVVERLSTVGAIGLINWRMTAPGGAVLFDTCLGCSQPGSFTLAESGVYTISVGEDRDDGVGVYSFQVRTP